ncbi:MAG: FAD-dependent oxidoreductase [Gammaproteobacteria bacterium]|nr:FAD-dependent oxidoreductase [Gammaproteobacteria bacterium]MBU0785604.1 FAD-dependent oxidoreductase [Gammaproteobacteria bacterium]MBU0816893.1 FAD-dependent oxidoreductase [Gammaproteobacteria bacterium]MBU1787057.1 FAD-dependent oxidoreductase [Gammaproteobacteria bacterium]
MKIAIIGSGISGLGVAHALQGRAELTLFEAGSYFGGHTHTVDITLPTSQGDRSWGVDTGFLVFNERTYPNLIRLFDELKVETAKTDMSFSVKAALQQSGRHLEWNGANLNTVFAQRGNLLNWRFLKMLREVLRFNALATALAEAGQEVELVQPLGDFLDAHQFSAEFRDWYFLPMMACIWSCPTAQMLKFPVSTMVSFCHNHGLIQVNQRPQWWTVMGGARHYVDKITARIGDKRLNTAVRLIERDAAGVTISTDRGSERFDKVVLATHSDQALALLSRPTELEARTLGAIHYQPNRAVLHTDAAVLPQSRLAWAAWNYERAYSPKEEHNRVCLHYLINKLQPVPFEQPVLVSLNPLQPIAGQHVLGEYSYAHPVFDLSALAAQQAMPQLQGRQHTYYCGAWMGYGFHEDGLKAGLGVARQLLVAIEQRLQSRAEQFSSAQELEAA